MATKSQGLLLGCSLALLAGLFLILAVSLVFRPGWPGGDLALSGDRVGLVVLEGPITDARPLLEEIDENRRDASIRAVVLRIDSPGGEVAPSQELYAAITRLAGEKPVVASVGSVAASGAFYAAIGADSILASPGSMVGSIGVILSYPTARVLMEKLGVEWRVYKSGRLKDMGSFAREPTEEEEEVFFALVEDVFNQFVDAVAEERGLDREAVLTLADGRVFTGRQAAEVGLIDGIGDLHAAVEMAAALGGLAPEPAVTRKSRPRIPVFDLLERFMRESARAGRGPVLEYRLR